jgi:hypothetical protein
VNFFRCAGLGWVPMALVFPCIAIGPFGSPLCGAAPTFFAAAKKAGCNRQPVVRHLGLRPGTAQDETCPRTAHVSDKALIRSRVALRAPRSGTAPSASFVGTDVLGADASLDAELLTISCLVPPTWQSFSIVFFLTSAVFHGTAAFSGKPIRDARGAEWVDECFATNVGGARDGLVFGPLTGDFRGGHLQAGGWKPAFFAYFLCGGRCVSR